MSNFLIAAQRIERVFNATPIWTLIKYGLIDPDEIEIHQLLDTPDNWSIFDFDALDECEEVNLFDFMWHDECPLECYENPKALWAKLIALGFGGAHTLSTQELGFISWLIEADNPVIYGIDNPSQGLMETFLISKDIEFEDVEWDELPDVPWVFVSPYKRNFRPAACSSKAEIVTSSGLFWNPEPEEVQEILSLLTPKDGEGIHKLGGLEWVLQTPSTSVWKSLVHFPEVGRSSRYYMVLNEADKIDRIMEGLTCWTWAVINLLAMGTSPGTIRQCLNRDATDMWAPATNYGSPSSLNIQVALGDVGFIEIGVKTPDAYEGFADYKGLWGLPRNQQYPLREHVVGLFQHKLGIAVLAHHQMSHIRVGPCAAATGISYLKKQEDDLGFIILDTSIDKEQKTSNRSALRNRTGTPVKVEEATPLEKADLTDW